MSVKGLQRIADVERSGCRADLVERAEAKKSASAYLNVLW